MKQEFVQEGMRTYLKIEGDDLENVGDKMFSYQTIPGFVPMEIEWVDEKKQYVYDVTTAVRIIPVIGKGVGETVEFGGLLGYAPIMPVNTFSCDAFVNRGGRIPAPIHSFKN